jgi:hypothetical protein
MGIKIPNIHKMRQNVIKYIYLHFTLQDSSKFTKFGNLGLKKYQLATLLDAVVTPAAEIHIQNLN